ncbi:MAG: gamma-glutamyl-gamma-aminobutyrate hydrolase family protein, partial [Candidatus Eremiobacterota bacterium]
LSPAMDPAEPDPAFDDFEIACIQLAYRTGMPMLGHCRGAQIMNVAAGGSLIRDIPTERRTPEGWGSKYGTCIDHRPESTRHDYSMRVLPAHLIVVDEGSRLHSLAGALESVCSIHHQCVDKLGGMLVPVAWALDGVVEGFQRKGMPWQAGYQFHPEAQRYTDRRYQGLYDFLVDDAVRFRRGELPTGG